MTALTREEPLAWVEATSHQWRKQLEAHIPREDRMDLGTRSTETLRASRRTIFVHALMHSIRHYAQLATLTRQRRVPPAAAMAYLFMGAKPAR